MQSILSVIVCKVMVCCYLVSLSVQVAAKQANNITNESMLHERDLQVVGSITGINIINAGTNEKIGILENGALFDLSQYGLTVATQLNFEFVTVGTVGSVTFVVTGSSAFSYTDNRKPFSLCGGARRRFYQCRNLQLGKSRIVMKPYSMSWERGMSGSESSIDFTIVNSRLPNRGDSAGAFDVTVSLTGTGLIQNDVELFQRAARRWSEIIVGDIPDVSSAGFDLPFPGCNAPATIDDVLICGDISPIDEEYGVLGYASGWWSRDSTSKFPFIGQMGFDSHDMPRMRNDGTLYPVILHEMGHVIGIGTLWESKGIAGSSSMNCPYYGTYGNQEYRALSGCTGSLPLEQSGGEGTRCGHFSDKCFKDELMTGWRSGSMPISRLTIASLQDLGYTVSYSKADAYSSANMNPQCVCNRRERNLRGEKVGTVQQIRSQSNNTWTQRKLSSEGYNNALKFGKKLLVDGEEKRQENLVIRGIQNNFNEENTISNDFVSVVYEDGVNGIFSILITANDI